MENESRKAETPLAAALQAGDDETANDLPPIMTVDELAAFLRLNRKTVYDSVSRGEIPGVRRIGHTFRISRDVVLRWLQTYSAPKRRSAP
jgi:excisionase family DNA binding protein